MSLRQAKVVYCIAIMLIGILLASHGEFIASILALAGALPMFHAVSGAAGDIAARAIIKNAESQDRPDNDALHQ